MRKVNLVIIIILAILSIIIITNLQPRLENQPNDITKNDKNNLYTIGRAKATQELTKIQPEQDQYPPQLHSPLYENPVPMPGPVNTAGAEDSPFILPCGCDFYFVFVPDVRIPPEKQLIDGASGIYRTKKVNGVWQEPERVILNDDVSLDGCHFIQGDKMWFCSVRSGNYREVDLYTAQLVEGKWSNWHNVGEHLNVKLQVGEMHLSSDGTELYFHSNIEGGKGGVDIWVTRLIHGEWQEVENLEAVNTFENEGMPFLNQAGDELWFNRPYLGSPAIYVTKKIEGVWQEPELIISQFAGEPTLDEQGNIYFVHHYYKDGVMLEADIYVSNRKPTVTPVDIVNKPAEGYSLGALPIPYEDQNIEEAYEAASETCQLVPVWGKPSPFWQKAQDLRGNWGNIFVDKLIRGNGMAPLLHFSFMDKNLTVSSPPDTVGSLSSREWRQQYKRSVIEALEVTKPLYLSLGNEVNRWYEKYGWDGENGFKHWVSLYEEIYEDVKTLSPETKVFCTFSREIVSENREADMNVLDYLNPDKLDILVLTSYPHSLQGINHPSDLPRNYYAKVGEKLPSKTLGFSEIMWPSMTQFGGEQAQTNFIQQLDGELLNGLELEFIMWSWLTDLDEGDYTGLIHRNGAEKQAYQAWKSLSEK
jgi:hypothetical protein